MRNGIAAIGLGTPMKTDNSAKIAKGLNLIQVEGHNLQKHEVPTYQGATKNALLFLIRILPSFCKDIKGFLYTWV